MKMEPGICAVCKGTLGGSEHRVSASWVCEACHKKDYLTAIEVSEMLDMHDATVSKYKRLKRYDLVPKQDAVRCIANPLWRRSTIIEFKKTIPEFNIIQLDILTELGLLRYEMARELGVDKWYLNKFCNKNRIVSNFVNKTTQSNDSEYIEHMKFNKANQLLNERLHARTYRAHIRNTQAV